LAYCREKDIEDYTEARGFPIIPCNLCGSQPNLQRQNMKQLLSQWEAEDPSRIASMLTALGNVKPSHLLDQSLYDFQNNQRQGSPDSSALPAQSVPTAQTLAGIPVRLDTGESVLSQT